MKRFWQSCMAAVATVAMVNAANAQWNQSREIGSYQSILYRAGYGDLDSTQLVTGVPVRYSTPSAVSVPVPMPVPPGTESTATQTGDQADDGLTAGFGYASGETVPNQEPGSGNYLDAGCTGDEAPAICPTETVCREKKSNWVFGLYGLSFQRDYDDGQRLTCNAAGDVLYTDDVTNGNMEGLGISIGKRGCGGKGWEAVFWGIDEESDVTLFGSTSTHLYGMGSVDHPPTGVTVQDIFDTGDRSRVFRDTDIYNFEFNLLRNVGKYTTCFGRCASYELIGGFRLFDFDESLRYVSYPTTPAYPATIEYSLEAENTLAGFQLGGRSEVCLSNRFRFAYGGTAGIYNNYIETRQQIVDSNGYWAMDYTDTKNDAAVMGQMDISLIYQLSCRIRARIGYRALGVAGVALADNQIPRDFTDTRALSSANSNGDLLLYGYYYGGEFCF